MGDWNADETSMLAENCDRWCTARLWYVPAKVGGTWKLGESEMALKQVYQTFSGTRKGAAGVTHVAGRLRGENIFFASARTQFTGRVLGVNMEGIERTAGKDQPFRAVRIGN
jgi:hypothetical protein